MIGTGIVPFDFWFSKDEDVDDKADDVSLLVGR